MNTSWCSPEAAISSTLSLPTAGLAAQQIGWIIVADNDQRETTTELAIPTATQVKRGTAPKASIEKRDNRMVCDIRIDTAAFYVDSRTGTMMKTVEKEDSH